jgi:mRNA-degrading endonuclease RelE of RelBE toxin-antitoxin system
MYKLIIPEYVYKELSKLEITNQKIIVEKLEALKNGNFTEP